MVAGAGAGDTWSWRRRLQKWDIKWSLNKIQFVLADYKFTIVVTIIHCYYQSLGIDI